MDEMIDINNCTECADENVVNMQNKDTYSVVDDKKSNDDIILKVTNLNKYFGSNHVLKDISFDMKKGEVIAIIGSSGGGKSTLLRCLTFLEKMTSGNMEIAGESIINEELVDVKPIYKFMDKETIDVEPYTKTKLFAKVEENGKSKLKFMAKVEANTKTKLHLMTKFVPTDKDGKPLEKVKKSIYPSDEVLRQKALKMGLVFQDFNLFPHKSVLENLIMAPMLVKNMDRENAVKLAREQLAKVGLSDKANAYPCEISGGQKQRVAIARALCMNPEILCFDEPTSALDPELTGEVLKVISELRNSNTTMLIVTHEIMFAREVADKVIFLDGGRILEMDDAKEVIDNPKKERTREFMDKILKG